MLDELDSLMERMLALPVNDLESQPLLGPDFHGATVSATMTLLDPQPSTESDAAAMQMGMGLEAPTAAPEREIPLYAIPEFAAPELAFSEQATTEPAEPHSTAPSFKSQALPLETDELASYLTDARSAPASEKVAVEPALDLLPDELMPPSILAMSTPPVEPRPLPEWTLLSLCLQPLVWANRVFDQCTMLFGPVGGLLRHPIGRNSLGIAGLGMIGLALAWLIKDWLGWTW
ncbi:MAG: hypothetical protein HY040_14225 [Planctomycetes bacterium]|nr:hypothetical protein [Planctomycetota bacterium]